MGRRYALWTAVAAALFVALLCAALPAPVRSARAAVPRCRAPGLVIWLNAAPGGAAAGSVYYRLEFTNLSGHRCTLRGAPGVSAVTLVGARIGSAATRATSGATTVSLAQGKTASAVLRVVDAQNYPASRCHAAIAAGVRVYPPGGRVSKVVPFAFRACRSTGVSVLSVKAVTAGLR